MSEASMFDSPSGYIQLVVNPYPDDMHRVVVEEMRDVIEALSAIVNLSDNIGRGEAELAAGSLTDLDDIEGGAS